MILSHKCVTRLHFNPSPKSMSFNDLQFLDIYNPLVGFVYLQGVSGLQSQIGQETIYYLLKNVNLSKTLAISKNKTFSLEALQI